MYEERTGIPIQNITIIITCSSGEVQVFRENCKDHVKQLSQTIYEYWQKYNFNKIQNIIKEKIEYDE